MRCPGLHCEGCRDNPVVAGLAGVGGLVAVAFVVQEFLTDLLIIAGTVVGLTLAVVTVMAVRMRRAGQLSLSPVVHWDTNVVRPVSSTAPVTARRTEALPAPQTVHVHIYGTPTRDQLAEVAAIREAGYRVFPGSEGR